MGQLTQTTAQIQVILDDADDANVGKTSLTDGSDTTAVAFKKSGFYSLQGSSSNAPSTDRAVLISAVRDTAATGEIRYGQIAITESNGLWWNRDDGGSLGTWYEAVTTASAQTLTNKTLTSPVLTTPQINDSAADHQYIFAGSNLVADRTVTLPLLTGNDTFVFEAHTQTLTNKTLTSPVLNTGVSGTAVLDADDFTGASATTLATSESIKAYVDTKFASGNELSEVLAAGNTTGSNDIEVTDAQKVQFRDAAIYINSSADGQLDIVADTEIQIAATTVDLNGNLDISGTATGASSFETAAGGAFTTATGNDLNIVYPDGRSLFFKEAGTTTLTLDNVQGATFAGEVLIPEKLSHVGDTDTHFKFAGADDIRIVAGNVEHAAFDGTIVFNQSGSSTMDFRVESDTNEHMLFVDSSLNRVGIANNSPASTLDVTGSVTADGLTVEGASAGGTYITSSSGPAGGDIKIEHIINSSRSLNTINSESGIDSAIPLAFATANTQRMLIASNGDISFYEDTGTSQALYWDASAERLGIGTTTINADLHLGAASPHIDIGPATGNRGKIGYNTNNVYIGSTSGTGEIHFKNNIGSTDAPNASGDTKMVIADSGVGIGTDLPLSLLDIRSVNPKLTISSSLGGTFSGATTIGELAFHTRDGSGIGPRDIAFIQAESTVSSTTPSADLVFGVSASNQAAFEAMRLNYSGNLLVGKTADDATTDGIQARGVGAISIARTSVAGDALLILNKKTNDGTIAEFRKDGVAVGSVACRSSGGNLQIHTNQSGIDFGGDGYLPMRGSTITDNSVDLGSSSFRYKNLYLSSGIQNITASGSTSSTLINAISGVTNGFQINANSSNQMTYDFNTGLGLKMRLTDSGNLLVGTTDSSLFNNTSGAGALINNGAIELAINSSEALYLNRMGTDGRVVNFRKSGSFVAGIDVTSTTVTYNTSSDQRLKENIVDAPSASDDIDAIQVRSFDWKADGSHQKYGMVAQELLEVAPEAVSQGDTEEDMMGVDYSKLVPMMLKEIQSLRARVAQLES